MTITDQAPTQDPVSRATEGGATSEGGTDEPTFTLKDGTTVTQTELINGYMRQSDYTRKTQDVANQRKELERKVQIATAIESDPENSLKTIADYYGVSFGTPQRSAHEGSDMDPFAEPEDPKVAALEAQIADLKRQVGLVATDTAQSKIEKDLQELEASHGEGFDRDAVLRHAQVNNLPIQTAYRDFYFEEAQQAMRAQQARQQAEAQVIEEKRATQGVVHQGSNPAAGTVGEPSGDASNVAEALQMALKQHGVDESVLQDPSFLWE